MTHGKRQEIEEAKEAFYKQKITEVNQSNEYETCNFYPLAWECDGLFLLKGKDRQQ